MAPQKLQLFSYLRSSYVWRHSWLFFFANTLQVFKCNLASTIILTYVLPGSAVSNLSYSPVLNLKQKYSSFRPEHDAKTKRHHDAEQADTFPGFLSALTLDTATTEPSKVA